MVVALFALSLVMVVGGVAAVIQGFPYVRLESGLAMVVGGATAASAGVILLGLSAVVARLRRIEDLLAVAPAVGRAAPAILPAPPAAPAGPVAPDFGVPPERSLAPALAGTAGLAGIAVAGAGAAAIGVGRRGTEPTFEDPAPAHAAASDDATPPVGPTDRDPAEPLLPDLLPPEPDREPHAPEAHAPEVHAIDAHPAPPMPGPDRAEAAEEDLFVSREPEHAREETLGLRPALAETPAPVASPIPAETPIPPEPETEAPERQVVGTYASGGNTYVMYADGSIQADTPGGLFRFTSLDELKAFVDSGGEADARGAA